MALTDIQNEFLKLQLANNPEFQAEYFPNVITQGPSGPLYNVDIRRDRPANVFYEQAEKRPGGRAEMLGKIIRPKPSMPSPPDTIGPPSIPGELSPARPRRLPPIEELMEIYNRQFETKKGAEFRDVNVPYDTKGSRINIIDDPSTIAGTAPWDQYYRGQPITGGQTSGIYMDPRILESYGTAPSSPRNEMVNTPDWYKKFEDYFGIEVPDTMDQAHLNDVIESILTHEVGHGVSGRKEYEGITEGSLFNFSEFLPPIGGEDYASEYDQEELYNRMKDIEKLKRLSPNNYEQHPLWDLYQRRAKIKFAELTGQKGWIAEEHPVKFEDYQKKIKPSVDAYLKKVGNRGISDINIAKEEIGMPQHLTLPPKKTYVAPPRGGGADIMPTPPAPISVPVPAHISGGDGGDQRGSMPTGTAEKNPWGRADGGLMDIPLTGRSRYI